MWLLLLDNKKEKYGEWASKSYACMYTLQFKDDQVIIANDKEDVEYMLQKLIEEYDKWRLKINKNKTKYLCVGETQENLQIEAGEIRICKKNKYLGVIFTDMGTNNKEVYIRIITHACKPISCLNSILWSREISKKRKFNIYQTMIKSSFVYGAETWKITDKQKKRIKAVEMDAIRTVRISRKNRIRNKIIKKKVGIDGSEIQDIEER